MTDKKETEAVEAEDFFVENSSATQEAPAEEKQETKKPAPKTEAKATTKKQKKKRVKPQALPVEVQLTLNSLEKTYGKGTIMQLGAASLAEVNLLYPTPSPAIDIAIGLVRKNANGQYVHGIPAGKIVEIMGPEASGKTTLCNHIMAAAQRMGGLVAMIDMENTWDPFYAEKVGVKKEDVVITQPDFGEQGLDTAEKLIATGKFSVVVVDSIASLVPKAELEGDMGQSHMGLQARLMSQACRKLSPLVNNTGTLLIFTNQIRYKIGVMFGNPVTTPGGEAMKFYASLRMEIKKVTQLKNKNGEVCGHRGRVTVIKNKLAPPYRKCEFDMLHNVGICRYSSLLEVAVQYGIMSQSGAWYAYGGEKIAQGKEKAIAFLKENPELAGVIEQEVFGMFYEDLYL